LCCCVLGLWQVLSPTACLRRPSGGAGHSRLVFPYSSAMFRSSGFDTRAYTIKAERVKHGPCSVCQHQCSVERRESGSSRYCQLECRMGLGVYESDGGSSRIRKSTVYYPNLLSESENPSAISAGSSAISALSSLETCPETEHTRSLASEMAPAYATETQSRAIPIPATTQRRDRAKVGQGSAPPRQSQSGTE
jgi:hypothetical protein